MANDKWSGNNPWLGLAPYTEGTPLYGRTHESAVLSEIIKDNIATIVYGKSGIGKSSLLSAGISPILRSEQYIPVPLRLVHNTEVSYVEQIENRVCELVECKDELPENVPDLGLWDFFHRHSFTKDGIACQPVIILDQFEEIYTLTDVEHKPDIITLFTELASLLNDIKPDAVLAAESSFSGGTTASASSGDDFSFELSTGTSFAYNETVNFRFVICLREDKLYLLERNSANIPSIKTNRYNLQALSPESALEVITCPRPDLFTQTEAAAIVDKLADMGDEGIRTVDPAILSLFLYKYFEKKGEANYDNIFADYYHEATKGIRDKSLAFLEDHLLTLGGYRNQIPVDDAISSGVSSAEIDSLLKQIILRSEKRKGIDYIEFSHDRLCAEAMKSREERKVREQSRKVRKRMLLSASVFVVSLGILSYVLFLMSKLQTAEEQNAIISQQRNEISVQRDSITRSLMVQEEQNAKILTQNQKIATQRDSIAAQRDALDKSLQIQAHQNRQLKSQLAQIQDQQRKIEELRSLAAVDSIVIEDNIAGKLSDRLPYTALSKASTLIVTGELNAEDIAYIKSALDLGNLRHLDLGNSYLVGGETYLKRHDVGVGGYITNEVSILTFSEAQCLESVSLPQNIKTIGRDAFFMDSKLKYISIPESVTSIEANAFEQCTNLSSIVIPNGVTDIGEAAFALSGLESIIIPNTVTSIANDAFGYCSDLSSIVVENGNPEYDSRDNCNAIINSSTNELILGCKNTVIPHGVTSIGKNAFYYCYSLQSITIPNSVIKIDEGAFAYSKALKSIIIPKSVTTIANDAFGRCSDLISIVVENGNPEFDSRDNCNAIINTSTNKLIVGCQNTIIPHSVTSIGGYAFIGRYGLKSITIPNSITSIEGKAFKMCYNLIHICSEIQDISKVNIDETGFGVDEDCVWQVPVGKVKEYMAQPWWKSSWKISEDSIETYRNLAYAYAKVNDYEKAEKYYKIVLAYFEKSNKEFTIQDCEKYAYVQNRLGAFYKSSEDYENSERYYLLAFENYEKLANNDPDKYREDLANTCWNIIRLYQALKKDEEYDQMLARMLQLSRQLYEKDKTKYRELAEALNLKAYQYAGNAQYALAMATIEEAISLVPNEANYYDSRGEILLMQGKEQEALQMWKKVLELNPDFLKKYPTNTNLYNGLKELGLIQ